MITCFIPKTNTNSAEPELIYSIRANDLAKEHIWPPSHGYAGRRNVWTPDPERHRRVSDRESCGDLTHGYTLYLPNLSSSVVRIDHTLKEYSVYISFEVRELCGANPMSMKF